MNRTKVKILVAGIFVILVMAVAGFLKGSALMGRTITVMREEELRTKYAESLSEEKEYIDDTGQVILRLDYRFPKTDAEWPLEVLNCLKEKEAEMERNVAEFISWHEHTYPFEYTCEVDPIVTEGNQYISLLTYERMLVGGAHADYYYTCDVFEQVSGQRLRLEDFVEISENAMRDVAKALNEAGVKVKVDEIKEAMTDVEFWVEDQGIMLVFNPYEVASFGEGALFVRIPLRKLKQERE